MGLYKRTDSPFWWALLEHTGRQRINTGILHEASTAEGRRRQEAAAEAIYHAKMTQLARQKVDLPIESTERFATFATWYATNHLEKHRGAARERFILKALRGFFDAYKLSEIRPATWTEYETHRMGQGISLNTIGRELALMKSILNAAVGVHLDVNALASVERKHIALPAKRTITAKEEPRLLAELHDDEIRDLYLVGVGTLLRQQNLILLRRRELHGNRLSLLTKTGPHQVTLDGPTLLQRRALTVLKRRLPKTQEGYVFPRWAGLFERNRDSGNAFFLKIFRRAVLRAGLPWGLEHHGVVWHTATRASGATRMLREFGIDVRTVQLLGGWSSLDQMAEYLGVDLSRIAAKPRSRRSA